MHSVRGTPRAPGMTCTYNMWWPHAGGGEAFSPAQQCHAGQDVEKDVSLTQNSVRLIFFNLVKIQRLKFGCKTRASLSTTAEWTKLLNLGPWKCLWIFTPWDSEAAHSIFFFRDTIMIKLKKICDFLKALSTYTYIPVKLKVQPLPWEWQLRYEWRAKWKLCGDLIWQGHFRQKKC